MGRNIVRETAPTGRRGEAGSASDWRVAAALSARTNGAGHEGNASKSTGVIAQIRECGRDTSKAMGIAKKLNGEDQSTRAEIAKAIALEYPRVAVEVHEATAIATFAEKLVECVGENDCAERTSAMIAKLKVDGLNTYYLGKIADAVHEFRNLDEQEIGAICRELRTGSREVQRRIVG